MRYHRVAALLLAGTLSMLLSASVPARADERDVPLRCMRACIPECLGGSPGNAEACEKRCARHCGTTPTFDLRDLRSIIPPLQDLTGVIGPQFSVLCGGGACVCSGASSCNALIALCPGDYVLRCDKYDEEGRPIACSCVNAG
jgi:hypothetical protein